MNNINGKTALITGASKGIGYETAIYLAEQGVNIVAMARSADALAELVGRITSAGGKAIAVAGDVSRMTDAQAAAQAAMEKFGSLDILVNNAGIIDPIARIEDINPAAWAEVINVNVTGVFNCLQACIAPMKQSGGGRVINISSGAATSALEGWSHYCASKAAVLSLTRCADLELHAEGISVVGLSPGTVATGMQVAIHSSGINPVSKLDPDSHRDPRDIAKTIAWLCSPEGLKVSGEDFSIKTEENRRLVGIN